jgi:uncharacterized membrane protein
LSELAGAPRVKLRIENLSDLVFGLALSIGSIVLISKLPQSPNELLTGIAFFGFSFLIVVWIWSGYTLTMSALPYEIRGTFLLNIVLLFCVAIEPYLFYVVTVTDAGLVFVNFASSVYALDVGAMLFILAAQISLLLGEEKKSNAHRLPPARLRRFGRVMTAQIASGAIFAVSALRYFWIPVPVYTDSFLRFDFWYIAIVVLIVAPRVERRPKTLTKEH